MIPSKAISVTTLAASNVGDLIKLLINGRYVFAMKFGNENQHVVLGTLSSFPTAAGGENTHPIHVRRQANDRVLNYGSDWVLEPLVNDPDLLGAQNHLYQPGRIVLEGNNYIALFNTAPNDHDHHEVWFDLTNNTSSDTPGNQSYRFAGWQIWESEQVRRTTGARPLVTIMTDEGA